MEVRRETLRTILKLCNREKQRIQGALIQNRDFEPKTLANMIGDLSEYALMLVLGKYHAACVKDFRKRYNEYRD